MVIVLCALLVLLMFLKLKVFGGISFRPEESVLFIDSPCWTVFSLVCIPLIIDYLFRACLIFGFFILIYFRSRCSLNFTFIVPCIIVIVSKNNQHDVTCGLSFIYMGSHYSFSTCFELSGSSSSGDHFSCTVSLWYSV